MAKVIIEFDLDIQEDKMYLNRCLKSKEMAFVLFDMKNNVKRKFKHSENDDFLQGVDAVIAEFNQLLEDKNIIIEDLTD